MEWIPFLRLIPKILFILATGFCPKNLAFARVWGLQPPAPWLIRLYMSAILRTPHRQPALWIASGHLMHQGSVHHCQRSSPNYQAFIGRIDSPICPQSGSGEEMANIYFYHAQGGQQNVSVDESIDTKDVFQDYVNLVEFLISSGHLPPHIGNCLTGSSWQQLGQVQALEWGNIQD